MAFIYNINAKFNCDSSIGSESEVEEFLVSKLMEYSESKSGSKINSVNFDIKIKNDEIDERIIEIEYMIGDCRGIDYSHAFVSPGNPFLDVAIRLLNRLTRSDCFNIESLKTKITKLELDFVDICQKFNNCTDEKIEAFFLEHGFSDTKENVEYLEEFDNLFVEENGDGYYLSFQGYELK